MSGARKLAAIIFSVVLVLGLLGVALGFSIRPLTQPKTVQSWLSQSNLYSHITDVVAQKAQRAIYSNVPGGIGISSTIIQKAASEAFPASSVDHDVQKFIASNYAWLGGAVQKPTFMIDLSKQKQQFVTSIAEQAIATHFKGLPPCSLAQMLQLQSPNPLLLSCLPAGISVQTATTYASQQLGNVGGYLDSPIITADSVSTKGINKGGEPYYKELSFLPSAYQWGRRLIWISIVCIALSVTILLLATRKRRYGIGLIAAATAMSGALLFVAGALTGNILLSTQKRLLQHISDKPFQQSVVAFFHLFRTELNHTYEHFAEIYLSLAIVLFIYLLVAHIRTKRQIKTARGPLNSSQQQSSDSNQGASNIKRRPPAKPPRLIQ